MNSYIRKLQSKSEDARKRTLYVTLAVTMSFVVFVWVYNLSDHFNSSTADQASRDIKPFSMFANSISGAYKNITASVGNVTAKNTAVPEQKQIDLIPVEPKQ